VSSRSQLNEFALLLLSLTQHFFFSRFLSFNSFHSIPFIRFLSFDSFHSITVERIAHRPVRLSGHRRRLPPVGASVASFARRSRKSTSEYRRKDDKNNNKNRKETVTVEKILNKKKAKNVSFSVS
jgi:hypothetical protein